MTFMLIKDRIYGEIKIEEKIIEDLIKTAAFGRLKKISQDGAPHFIQPVRNVTRFEHSIGVWYLSSLYKRSVEEQIASLLHDLSHTAFSHVIDFVVEDKEHEFSDNKLKEVVLKSDIPEIIKAYGCDLEKILDKTRFPLLENKLPDLSVDRWDYFMRDGYAIGFLPAPLIQLFMTSVFEKDNAFYFKDMRIASTFAILFASFSRLIWLDPTSHGSFFLVANAIKAGLANKIITEEDFFTDDELMLNKLRAGNNRQVNDLLDRLQPGNEFVYEEESEAEFYGPNKPRCVDPFVDKEGKLTRISEIVPSLGCFFEEFAKKYKFLGVNQIVK